MSSGSTVLKRVAFLNRSGILPKPLRYSEIRSSLEGLGETGALKVLQELEEDAANISDPVEFIQEKVGVAELSEPGLKRKAPDADLDNTVLAKRVRMLNNSDLMVKPIDYPAVKDSLGSLQVGQAMAILTSLEDVADGVLNPTKYINLAVRNAGGLVFDADMDEEDEQADDAADINEPEADEDADEEEADEEEEEPRAPSTPPKRMVKTEPGMGKKGKGKGKGKKGKGGKGKGKFMKDEPFWGVKSDDLSERHRIERRVSWLNSHAALVKEVEFENVSEALESIGTAQAMRVLRRLEESAETIPEPEEFIHDLVGRSGWIWAKTDVIDEDSRVAKRVTWLNNFGGLKQPINYVEVADLLDGLKVQHAMVMLREIEMTSNTIGNPTEYIKRAAEKAGVDEVQPIAESTEDSQAGQRIAWLNDSGSLAAKIDFAQVADGLSKIGDDEGMSLIAEVEQKGKGVKNPTAFIKFKLKAKLASMGFSLEEGQDDETKIVKRIEWLNDYGGLMVDIDYNMVHQQLESVGITHAMTVLKELEDNKESVLDPTAFIKDAIESSRKRAAVRSATQAGTRSARAAPAAAPAGGVASLTSVIGMLNRNSKVTKPVKFSDVAGALDSLGPDGALRVLQEMQEKGLGLADPVQYIRSKAAMANTAAEDEEVDDVSKIENRLNWLNKFGGLVKKIKTADVVGALYCLGIPTSMAILKGLQEKAKRVADPTAYIKAAVQRANGVYVPPDALGMAEEEDYPEEYAAEPDADEEEVEAGEEVGEVDEYGAGEEDFYTAALAEASMDDDGGAQAPMTPPGAAEAAEEQRRVVGGVKGLKKLTSAPTKARPVAAPRIEFRNKEEASNEAYEGLSGVSPHEKMIQCRKYALDNGLNLEDAALRALAKLPFYKAKDLLEETLLGGKNRQGVTNASRYIMNNCQRMSHGLGVEQGIAMELAVSLGVVLNNEALDELASVPRKEAHSIIRDVSRNEAARTEPIDFIRAEVGKCRAQLDSRPFPPRR